MPSRRGGWSIVATFALACAACHGDPVGDFQAADSAPSDASADTSASTDADAQTDAMPHDSPAIDAHHDGAPLDAGPLEGGVTCPAWSDNGPRMVQVHPKFCIDDLEVDRQDFNQFLDTSGRDGGVPVPPSPRCDGNTLPAKFTTDINHPANVDWCDAWMFCAWAGKRLCGKIDGGSWTISTAGDWRDPSQDQWSWACRSGPANTSFPYGDVYEAGTCNDKGSLADDKSFAGCTGPAGYADFDFIYDLSGNAEEWVDTCDNDTPSFCAVRGGYYGATGDDMSCDAFGQFDVRSVEDFIGFRCCYP